MLIEYDPEKREATLRSRGLDFEDAARVLANRPLVVEDVRRPYPERRFNALGHIGGRLVNVTFRVRRAALRIISMRYANRRERAQYEQARNRCAQIP